MQKNMIVAEGLLKKYQDKMTENEKSPNTIAQYTRAVGAFLKSILRTKTLGEITKDDLIAYREELEKRLKASSVNAKIIALNHFFEFINRPDLKIKTVRCQKQLFIKEERELKKNEYKRLVRTAIRDGEQETALIMETICATGIRVSELKYIKAESLLQNEIAVTCKGKTRVIFLPQKLSLKLATYCREREIKRGSIFTAAGGAPIDRTTVWRNMQKVAEQAGVPPDKVFPHNLRHLFARTFYAKTKDLNRLADVLGHSSIETTRKYTITTGKQEKETINNLGLIS